MHRIDEYGATVDNQFTEGDPATATPATKVTNDWLNAVQEEVANVIENYGVALDKLDNTQLYTVIAAAIAAAVTAHGDLTTAHDSTSAATASKIMQRDAAGRAKVAAPAAAADIALKDTVDTHGNLTTAHDSTSAATASKIMQRDAAGRAKVAAPAAADDIARKDTVDTHADLTAPHGAQTSFIPGSLALRDAAGRLFAAHGVAGNYSVPNMLQFAVSLGANGYQQLPSGLIIQWGRCFETTSQTFPIAFPSVCRAIVATLDAGPGNTGEGNHAQIIDNAHFSVSHGTISTHYLYWIAIGY
jgi:hypothetical protein